MAKKHKTTPAAATSPTAAAPTPKVATPAPKVATPAPEAATTSQLTAAPTHSAPLQIMDSPAPTNKSEPQKTSTEPPKAAKAEPPKTTTEPSKAKTDSVEKPKKMQFIYEEDREDALKTLGLGNQASAADIKKAYRKEALAHHPDKQGDVSKFQQAANAYEYLIDTKKKPRAPVAPDPTPQSRANQQPSSSRPTHASQQPRTTPPPRTSSSFNTPPSRSYASQHASNSHSHSQKSNHRSSNQQPRTQAPRQQQPINLSPMAQTQQPARHWNTPHHNLIVIQRKNDEKINHILNNSHFDSPPRRIREPGHSNEKIAFGNAKDALTFASAAAKEGVPFQIKDSKSNILAYSNGDGKLYTGKHTEYKPGQKLDPVSPKDFQTPRSPQMGM